MRREAPIAHTDRIKMFLHFSAYRLIRKVLTGFLAGEEEFILIRFS